MKKIKIVMFAVVVIAITALNVRTVLSSDRSYDMNTSTIEAISGEDDPIDGGEIGGLRLNVVQEEVEIAIKSVQKQ